jgi:hypothetical protein
MNPDDGQIKTPKFFTFGSNLTLMIIKITAALHITPFPIIFV